MCYASEPELAQAQHLFASETHCFAARGQLAAVSAVLEQRVARVPSAVVVLDPVFTTVATQDQANFIYEQLTCELFTSANHLVRTASLRVRSGAVMREIINVLESVRANRFGVRELDVGRDRILIRTDIHRDLVRYRRMVEHLRDLEDCTQETRALAYDSEDGEGLSFLSPAQDELDRELAVSAEGHDGDAQSLFRNLVRYKLFATSGDNGLHFASPAAVWEPGSSRWLAALGRRVVKTLVIRRNSAAQEELLCLVHRFAGRLEAVQRVTGDEDWDVERVVVDASVGCAVGARLLAEELEARYGAERE